MTSGNQPLPFNFIFMAFISLSNWIIHLVSSVGIPLNCVLSSRNWWNFFCIIFTSPKSFTCLLHNLRTEFPQAKSICPTLSETIFFAHRKKIFFFGGGGENLSIGLCRSCTQCTCYNQLQKFFGETVPYFGVWPVHDLVHAIPPPLT